MTARQRERVLLAALVALAVLLFDTGTTLDLRISAWFHDGLAFPADHWPLVRAVYWAAPWLWGAVTVGAAGVCLLALWRPAVVPRWLWRRCAAQLLCMVLGVGLLVHAGFKDHWGRPRPDQVQAFGGTAAFAPALVPSDTCARNCSFVSGHAAGGFALVAVGLFGAPRTRRRWLLAGLVAGALVGAVRVAQGRHFASDIVFGAALVWATSLLLRELWLRLRLLQRAWRRAGAPPAWRRRRLRSGR